MADGEIVDDEITADPEAGEDEDLDKDDEADASPEASSATRRYKLRALSVCPSYKY